MFNVGIDVTIMCVIGLICIVGTAVLIWWLKLPEDYAQLILGVAASIAAIMIAGYIVMACVLDRIVGIYW